MTRNSALVTLSKYAAIMATEDTDEDARPLWGQIRDEVDAYLDPEDRAPGPLDEPLWGER